LIDVHVAGLVAIESESASAEYCELAYGVVGAEWVA
jgi:hypothetical protein